MYLSIYLYIYIYIHVYLLPSRSHPERATKEIFFIELQYRRENLYPAKERIFTGPIKKSTFIELVTSDRKLKASKRGSK
jgi:hypothetical protein